MKLNTNISLENIVTIIALICSVTLAFGFMKYDIDALKRDKKKMEEKAKIVRENYELKKRQEDFTKNT